MAKTTKVWDGSDWQEIAGIPGAAGVNGTNGVGVPAGGSTNAILAKTSSTDYNTAWTLTPSLTSLTLSGDLAVDGGDITTSSSTFNLASTSTTLSLGPAGGTGNSSYTVNIATAPPNTGSSMTLNLGTGSYAGGASSIINIGANAAIVSTVNLKGTVNHSGGNFVSGTNLTSGSITSSGGYYYGPSGDATNAYIRMISGGNINIVQPVTTAEINLGNSQCILNLGNNSGITVYSAGINGTTSGTGTTLVMNTTTGLIRKSSSSLRYKSLIEDINISDDDILSIRPITYVDKEDFEEIGSSARRYFGIVAEEIEQIESLKDLVLFNENGEAESLMYDRVVPLLVQVCRNQRDEINLLKGRLDSAGL